MLHIDTVCVCVCAHIVFQQWVCLYSVVGKQNQAHTLHKSQSTLCPSSDTAQKPIKIVSWVFVFSLYHTDTLTYAHYTRTHTHTHTIPARTHTHTIPAHTHIRTLYPHTHRREREREREVLLTITKWLKVGTHNAPWRVGKHKGAQTAIGPSQSPSHSLETARPVGKKFSLVR